MQSHSAFSVADQVIIVTGGFGQIGRAAVRALVEAGAKVAVLEPNIESTRQEAAFGGLVDHARLACIAADVTNKVSVQTALEAIEARWGTPHGLVNNAALDSPPDSPPEENGPFETYPERSFDRIMEVNVKGVFLCSQVIGAAMARAGRGSIVNVASIYGTVSPDQALYEYRRQDDAVFYKPAAYAVSKSALYNLTRYLAVYWGPRNVRTNTVTFAGVYNGQDPRFLAAYGNKIPLRRAAGDDARGGMANPEDYVGPLVFLLSDASSYMTGADLRVDGGFLAL